jgi:Asp-tRNA(Asn)/Glu-tRNA(Gln) amidotransferase A subunit family amidase
MRDHAGRWRVDPKDSTSADLPVPDFEAALTGDIREGLKIGIPKEYRIDGMPAEIDALWQQGIEMAEGRGRRDRRHLAAAHQIRAARLLHRRAGRGLLEPRPL